MKQSIRVSVKRPDRQKTGSFDEIYRQYIVVDDSLDFDYKVILKALKLLYPEVGNIIEFQIVS